MAFKTSTERYDRLVDLTRKLTGIQSLPDGYGQWEALVRVWRLYRMSLQCNDILFATFHYLKWGSYPQTENDPRGWALNRGTPLEKDTAELMALFCEELVSPGAEGAAELHSWYEFKNTYRDIGYSDNKRSSHVPESHSWTHYHYRNDRFYCILHTFDPAHNSWTDYKHFEEAIHFLLPSSSAWTAANWLDEGFVLQELDRAFGTNLRAEPKQLNHLIDFVEKIRKGFPAFGYILAELPVFPYDLAKAIWPVDTIAQISAGYIAIIQEAQRNERLAKRRKSKTLWSDELGFSKVKDTGIHKLARDLVSNGTIRDRAIKDQVFDMEFGH